MVLRLAALRVCVMAVLCVCVCAVGCPSGCRCYSLTVECGSIGLKEIPQGIAHGTQTIFLQDNAVGQVRQQDLSGLAELHYLYLQNNSISVLEGGAFLSLSQLLELALNGNRIQLISADVFRGLEHLRILYLASNHITHLEDHTFHGLQRLQELHLQGNRVETVGERALVGLSSLALLDLSRNKLHSLGPAALQPLISLQVLRITENPWRCDCALHWMRGWINQEGQRLLSSAEQRLVCAEPPRLSHLSLVEVPANSLVCIPPVVQLERGQLTVRLGESLRVSCQASGYPQPQVTWRKASRGRTLLSPRGLVQEAGPGAEARPGMGAATARPGGKGGAAGRGPVRGAEEGGDRESFDPDTGSGMLFLSNVTVAHAGRYECEAWNPGGVARVTFHLSVNMSSSSSPPSLWPRPHPPSAPHLPPPSLDVSREPLYELESMDFSALGPATQTAIAAGISLLALTALLLLCMIYSRHRGQHKHGAAYGGKDESILYVNDYSDGPTTFAQLEEYRDERGHEMFVLNRAKPVLPPPPPPAEPPRAVRSPGRAAGSGPRRAPAEGGEGPPADPEGLFINQSLLFDTQIAYEIHC